MRFSPRIFLKPLFKADDLCVIYAEHRLFLLPRKGVFMDFLTSLAVICLSALLLGSICSKIKLPPLFGMLIIGIVLGPYVLDLISPSILGISADLRELALIIILTRAGLNLNLKDLKKNGISAVLLCFLPATAEILGYVLLGSLILRLPVLDSAILGSVMAAVSPAVVVPRMLKLKETGYGTDKGIPDMIMTGASADDVFVIVLFTSLTAMSTGGTFSWNIVWQVPVSIILGIGAGIAIGLLFVLFVKRFHIRDSIKVIFILSIAFLFVALENAIEEWVPYSGLLSVISFGAVVFAKHEVCAKRLSGKFSKLWVFAEILLFVLVGAEVNIGYALNNCGIIICVIILALVFRMAGVFLCVAFSKLNMKERLFCMIAYSPKATVQAAIGAVPLAMGLACGQIVLTAAVLAILITAPLGAFLSDLTYKKLLTKTTVSDGVPC